MDDWTMEELAAEVVRCYKVMADLEQEAKKANRIIARLALLLKLPKVIDIDQFQEDLDKWENQ